MPASLSSFKNRPHFQSLWVKTMHFLLTLAFGCLSWLAPSAMAQPIKGTVYKDFLPMGSGASVPLPEGAWQLTHTGLIKRTKEYEAFTLRNQQADAKVPFLVVRQSTLPGAWPSTNCALKNAQAFMVNHHDSLQNQLLNKCSRVFAISHFDSWKGMSGFNENDRSWWGESVPGLVDLDGPPRQNMFQVEFTVQQFNGKHLRVDAFVLPPKVMNDGLTSAKFKEGFMASGMKTEYDILATWNSIYIDSLYQSYFNKKPQAIVALAYPVKSRGTTQWAGTSANAPAVVPANQAPQKSESALVVAAASSAKPVKGAVYKDFLPLGAGVSVPLPEGTWQATHVSSFNHPGDGQTAITVSSVPSYLRLGYVLETYTLKNQQPDAQVPFVVVRQSTTVSKWVNTPCASNNALQFMANEHGSTSSQLFNKCSRMFAIGNFESWQALSWANAGDKEWWSEAVQGMANAGRSLSTSIFQVELTVQQFNGNYLRLDAFVLPPKGMTAAQFRDDFKAGRVRPEHDVLSRWNSNYIESMQQSYFNKKPRAIVALAYPGNTTGATQWAATSSTPPAADSAMSATDAETLEKARDQRTEEILREIASASGNLTSQKPAPAAPVIKPVTATPLKPAEGPAVASNTDKAAQARLEQERRAMEDEKRTMTQQLAAMTEMLSKLQQENAAAAKAKELAAATPEPVAQPSKPLTFANRKALVIGNDLYTHVPRLSNAGADADAMAKSLESVGYKVYKHLNLSEKRFKQAVRDFRQQLNGGDEVLFFYAGHGVQLGNANYLLPIDVQGEHEEQVKDDAILLQKVLDDLDDKKTKFALAVIDACRDNPFKGKGRAIGGRGLAPTSAATGQMIMFSAGSGQQALDRLGDNDKEKNGLFTRIFIKEMVKPGVSVDRVLRNVRNEVVRLARSVGHEQTPALYDQAIGEFYFKQ